MTRHVILGNGNMLVCIDRHARIRDFYYPYVGQDNHVSSQRFMIGVWVDGRFSWVDKDNWDLSIKYKKDSLVSNTTAHSPHLNVTLVMEETVHPNENIFLRGITVKNEVEEKRDIRVFFSQHFNINEDNIGDTVYYDPHSKSVIDYKDKVYFLIGGQVDGEDFPQYTTGMAGVGSREGTWKDAEDGHLTKNPIEHGSVDSTIGFNLEIEGNQEKRIDYWITVGKKYQEVVNLRDHIRKSSAKHLIEESHNYWSNWSNNDLVNFFDHKDTPYNLGEHVKDLFKRSLLVVKAQTDKGGAIIAANDSHVFRIKNDTYSYMWPRDGALISRSFDKVEHFEVTEKFFEFCANVVNKEGYLLHKYRPNGSLGSSWHSWLDRTGTKPQLPIQEDETALVLDALWKHYKVHRNDEKMKDIYNKFIKKAGDFLVRFRDEKTGLPKESYDLWEEKLGVHTFTCCTVYAGLKAAAEFSSIFGNKNDAANYKKVAEEIREAMLKYLYDFENKVFVKGIHYNKEDEMVMDYTVDASTFYGLFEYKVLNFEDPRLTRTFDLALEKLWNNHECGGLARYENDRYYKIGEHADSNVWFISTMWLAEYYIEKATKAEDLIKARELIDWVTRKALPSGVLSEQLNPYTSETLSVAPLTWSHAGFIIAVVKYLEKYEKLEGMNK